MKLHKISFTVWLKDRDIPQGESNDETAVKLSSGPYTQITLWQGYDINGYRFHAKEKDKKNAALNSSVRYEDIDESMG